MKVVSTKNTNFHEDSFFVCFVNFVDNFPKGFPYFVTSLTCKSV